MLVSFGRGNRTARHRCAGMTGALANRFWTGDHLAGTIHGVWTAARSSDDFDPVVDRAGRSHEVRVFRHRIRTVVDGVANFDLVVFGAGRQERVARVKTCRECNKRRDADDLKDILSFHILVQWNFRFWRALSESAGPLHQLLPRPGPNHAEAFVSFSKTRDLKKMSGFCHSGVLSGNSEHF